MIYVKSSKVVSRGDVARKLLKMGFQIIDVKASKENPLKSLFVFKYNEKLEEALTKLLS
jgi:hypothetical protein